MVDMESSKQRRLELLSKTFWNYKDIMDYFGFNRTKAFDCKKKAIDDGYGVMNSKMYVKPDGVLKFFDTSVEKEIEAILKTNEKLS